MTSTGAGSLKQNSQVSVPAWHGNIQKLALGLSGLANKNSEHPIFEFQLNNRSCFIMCVCAQSDPTFCDPTDCSPPGSSVHGISQASILEWVVISFSNNIFYKLFIHRQSSFPKISSAEKNKNLLQGPTQEHTLYLVVTFLCLL